MSLAQDLLAQGRDLTRAVVGYVIPLDPGRLEPMELPHSGPPPVPPGGQAIRQVLRLGSERAALQLDAGGRGIVARMLAQRLESTTFRELRSDQIAHRRAAAGRTPAKPTRTRQWLFGSDQSATPAPAPRTMAEAVFGGCADCPK